MILLVIELRAPPCHSRIFNPGIAGNGDGHEKGRWWLYSTPQSPLN